MVGCKRHAPPGRDARVAQPPAGKGHGQTGPAAGAADPARHSGKLPWVQMVPPQLRATPTMSGRLKDFQSVVCAPEVRAKAEPHEA
eukprot:13404786-Alexandrium_andersonii.AAC.1